MRLLRRALVAIAVLLFAAVAGVGWYYSNEILGPDEPLERRGQSVKSHTDTTITLTPSPKSLRPGWWAIEWPGGYGELGPEIGRDHGALVRRFRLAAGAPPETTARLAGFAFDANPRTWFGIPFEEIPIRSRIGTLPAWRIAGPGPTWAIFVHGRGATRAEVLRMLPFYRAQGMPCLVISYRNDPGLPRVQGGGYRMGVTEWEDLEVGVRFALDHGARDVVLVGCSMGGGIVTQFLRRSALRSSVRGAVLDAPVLDWEAVLARASEKRRVPAPVTALGMAVSTLRSGIHWRDLTQALHAGEFVTPMLIFHGESDQTVPIAVSVRFAAARPDLVLLVRIPEADHVESSNYQPERYRRVLTAWLEAHGVARYGARSVLSAGDTPRRRKAL